MMYAIILNNGLNLFTSLELWVVLQAAQALPGAVYVFDRASIIGGEGELYSPVEGEEPLFTVETADFSNGVSLPE